MGISKPIVSEIAYRTLAINEFGMATCYLVWGDDRGILIDAGCGMYNIKEIADELCPVPYDVVITHAHGDHIGSIDRFEEIYLHEADLPAMDPEVFFAGKDMLVGHYPEMMAAYGTFEAYDISPSQARYPEKLPKINPIKEGHVFHLGSRDIDVIHTPGHTPGEIVLIDPTERILFSGDGCNTNLGISSTSMTTAYKGLLRLKAREKDFDRNFNGHIGYGGSNVHQSLPEGVLDECLHIMKGLIDGTIEPEHKPSPFRPGSAPTYFVKYGHTLINFREPRYIDEGEEPVK